MGREQVQIEYQHITERLTDQEIEDLDASIDCYLSFDYCSSDYYASRINRDMWKPIWEFRKHLDQLQKEGRSYYAE